MPPLSGMAACRDSPTPILKIGLYEIMYFIVEVFRRIDADTSMRQ